MIVAASLPCPRDIAEVGVRSERRTNERTTQSREAGEAEHTDRRGAVSTSTCTEQLRVFLCFGCIQSCMVSVRLATLYVARARARASACVTDLSRGGEQHTPTQIHAIPLRRGHPGWDHPEPHPGPVRHTGFGRRVCNVRSLLRFRRAAARSQNGRCFC
jgi:hypothetical protein